MRPSFYHIGNCQEFSEDLGKSFLRKEKSGTGFRSLI